MSSSVINPLIKHSKQLFYDSIKIKVVGGRGGPGLPMYGGIGGAGGDVIIKGDSTALLKNLAKMNPTRVFKAKEGRQSFKHKLVGNKGQDLNIPVPVGVTVEDDLNQHIGDINSDLDSIVVAMGGRGGDKFNDNHGHVGQSKIINLILKVISDVGFVGFPNAGKSTLLKAISNATPKVAAFPFTTLRPYLGTVEYEDLRKIKFTDLPGLVEGAHENLGLGHDFLKHVQRSRMLCFVVDIEPSDLGPTYPKRSPLETLSILNSEIEKYDDTILNKPAIIVLSKVDTISKQEIPSRLQTLKHELKELECNQRLAKFADILPISAHNGFNMKKFLLLVRDVLDRD